MSLRAQLVATILAVLVATLWLGALLVHWHAVAKIDTEMTAALGVGDRIARSALGVADAPHAEPGRVLPRLVAHFDGDRHLKAYLIDPAGAVAQSSQPAAEPHPAPQWLESWLSLPPRRITVALPESFGAHGSLVLETYAGNEIAEVWDDLQVYAKLLAVYGIGGLGVTLAILALAMRPLGALSEAIARIGAGDFAVRLDERGPTELAELARGFNTMTSRLAGAEGRNRELVDHLSRVQEEERAELARNLHDEVGPLLFSVDVDANAIGATAAAGRTEGILDKARSIQSAAQAMKRNVRGIIEQLRPETSEDVDWQGAVRSAIDFWRQRFPAVRMAVRLEPDQLPGEVAVVLKYVIGEAVANAVKHGRPSEVSIAVATAGDRVTAVVRDDGGGLSTAVSLRGHAPAGHGIVGMRERVERAGGRFLVGSLTSPPGVEVRAELPLRGHSTETSAANAADTGNGENET